MNANEQPELIDWNESRPRHDRYFGIMPSLALGGLLLGGLAVNQCYPRPYNNYRDYYTCSPKYICKPVPYWPGL